MTVTDTAQSLHRESMDLVNKSELSTGGPSHRRQLLLEAFRLEKEAAESLKEQLDEEPSRSVLYRSAASLALRCGEYNEARRLVSDGLKGRPPEDIHQELLEVSWKLKGIQDAERPSVEQVAWVFRHLSDNLEDPGSFRKVIYDKMGFGSDAYSPLYLAGGMNLTNSALDIDDWLTFQLAAWDHAGISLFKDGEGWTIKTQDDQVKGSGKDLERAIVAFRSAIDSEIGIRESPERIVEALMEMPEAERSDLWGKSGHSGQVLLGLVAERRKPCR